MSPRTARRYSVAYRGLFLLLLGVGVLLPPLYAQPAASEAPLFEADDLLELTLTMDMGEVLRDRSEDPPYYPAVLTYRTEAGEEVRLETGVRPRGYYRLHHLGCHVPPLRLNLKRGQVPGTVFEGQNKLKLVTHCRNGSTSFERYVVLEYLVYKAYNLLTDLSFRARLARITYTDSRGRQAPRTAYAFLIEDEDRMAERNGGAIVDGARIHPEATDREAMTLLAVFQYMIGNTDWTVWDRHNIKLVFLEAERKVVAVPYDFDWAGLVGTRYAVPDPQLGISSVRQRRYMGFCRTDEELAPIFARLVEQEAAFYDLFARSPHLPPEAAEDAVAYLREFFDELRDGRALRRALPSECLASSR